MRVLNPDDEPAHTAPKIEVADQDDAAHAADDDAVSAALKQEAAQPSLRARPEPPPPPSAPAAKATSPRAAAAPTVRTGPATCDKCVKILGQPPARLRCFARASEQCRAHDGHNDATLKWHHVSGHEHFCNECAEHYSRGVRAPRARTATPSALGFFEVRVAPSQRGLRR